MSPEPIRVCLDARVLEGSVTGIGRYAAGLVNALRDFDTQVDVTLLARTRVAGPERVIVTGRLLPDPLWELFAAPAAIRGAAPHLVHGVHEGTPRARKTSIIATLHDLIPLEFPDYYLRNAAHGLWYRSRLKFIADRAEIVMTDSSASFAVIQDRLGIPEERLRVVPIPPGQEFAPVDAATFAAATAALGLPSEYVLGVGSPEPRKGLETLLAAYERLPDSRRIPLVLIGQKWRHLSNGRYLRGTTRERVVVLDYVPAPFLPAVYTGASVFVFPSFAEGYGLPILEAMACGCPVITSNTSSMPEVAGGAALLVDPHSVEDVSGTMMKVLDEPSLASRLRAAGLARAGQLSWERLGASVLSAYQEVSV